MAPKPVEQSILKTESPRKVGFTADSPSKKKKVSFCTSPVKNRLAETRPSNSSASVQESIITESENSKNSGNISE